MATLDELRRTIKVIMFDQFGTIVDMQTGLTAAATPFLQAKGWTGDPHSFVTWWRRTHFENSMIDALLQKEHTSYREIGRRSVSYVLDRAHIPYTDEEVDDLVSHIEQLKPFADVPAALLRLKPHYSLAVLSNGDPDMLETAQQYHLIAFDRVISVATAHAFKPHVATYTKAAEIMGVPMNAVLFVANHSFDCIGAKAAGMSTAFVNRRGRPFGRTPYSPDLTVSSMKELADRLIP